MMHIKHLLAAIGGLLLTAAAAVAANPSANLSIQVVARSAGVQAMRAFDFYDKWGVNGTQDGPGWMQTGLNTLHLNRVRLDTYTDYSTMASLAASGVKILAMMTWYNQPPLSASSWLQGLKNNVITPHPGAVTAISGPNEVNLVPGTFCYPDTSQCGIAAANAAQHDMYVYKHSDPAFANIPLDMWPLGLPWTNPPVGDQTANCDQAEIHDYYGIDDINQTFGTATGSAAVDTYYGIARQVCNRPKVVTSEDGFCTPLHANCPASNNMYATEYTVARAALNTMIDHAKRPDNAGVYYFTMCCGDGWWALLRDYTTPKAQGAAIANFMTIVNDPGANAQTFVPGALSYSVSGAPAATENFLMQKSNGVFMIVIENHRSIWNHTTDTQIAVPTVPVTVTLPRPMSGGIYDATSGTTPISTFNNVSSVVVNLSDAPLIVQAQ